MKIKRGSGTTEYGPGVSIHLTGDEVAMAIDMWILSKRVLVSGPRTVVVNGGLCQYGEVKVDSSGFVKDFDKGKIRHGCGRVERIDRRKSKDK